MGVCLLLSCSCRWFDGKTDFWFSPRGWRRGHNWRASSARAVVSFNNYQILLQVELCFCRITVCAYVCMCVSVSNFDWKTCLTSCDFSQPYNTAGQCDWRQLSGISDTTSSCSVEQFVSHYGSQSLNQSVNQQAVELASYRRQQQRQQHVWQLLMELRQALLTHFSVKGAEQIDCRHSIGNAAAHNLWPDLVETWLTVDFTCCKRLVTRIVAPGECCLLLPAAGFFFSLPLSLSSLSLFRFAAWQAIRINCNKLAKRQQAAASRQQA